MTPPKTLQLERRAIAHAAKNLKVVQPDPGKGVLILDTGRVVFDAREHVSFDAGQHEVLHCDIDQLACSALAAR
jgi:hypothetical protein